jgi:hypothetical protein
MTDVNEIAVCVSALLALAVGSIWYSPLLFGKYWQRAAGLSDNDLELSRTAFIRSVCVAFMSNFMVLLIIAYLVRFSVVYALDLVVLGAGVIVLLASATGSMVVWEKRSLIYFAIHVGYAAVVVILGFFVIAYWPW